MKFFKIVALFLIVLLLTSTIDAMGEVLSKDKAASDFTLESLSGGSISLSDYRDKSSLILSFWTTWCPYCVTEMGDIKAQYSKLKSDGFEALAVNIQEDRQKVSKFANSKGLNFPILLDKDGSVSKSYGVRGIPAVFIIGKDGKIKFSGHQIPKDYLKFRD